VEKALLVIYVDDFQLSAPKGSQDKLWRDLRKRIEMEEPHEPARFLGCYRHRFNAKANDVQDILRHKPQLYPRPKQGEKKKDVKPLPLSSMKKYDGNREIHGYLYDMGIYFDKNVQRYLKEAGEKNNKKLKRVDTPFLDEAKEPMGVHHAARRRGFVGAGAK